MSIDEIYSEIKKFITSGIVGPQQHTWQWAKMEFTVHSRRFSGKVSYDMQEGREEDYSPALQSKQEWYRIIQLIKQLHQQTIEAGAAEWNMIVLMVHADRKMEVVFDWDEDLD